MISKRILASRHDNLKQEIKSLEEGGVNASFKVYKNYRDKEDIGGMLADLARVIKYKKLIQLAQQELTALQNNDKKKANELRDWRSNAQEIANFESNAFNKLTAEYAARCPKQDKLPHEVLNIKLP